MLAAIALFLVHSVAVLVALRARNQMKNGQKGGRTNGTTMCVVNPNEETEEEVEESGRKGVEEVVLLQSNEILSLR